MKLLKGSVTPCLSESLSCSLLLRSHESRHLEAVSHLITICSEVVDVFTAAPNQGGFGSRVQSMEQLHIGGRVKPSTEEAEAQGDEQDDQDTSFSESEAPKPQEMVYRSIRKIPEGVSSGEVDKEGPGAAGGAMV